VLRDKEKKKEGQAFSFPNAWLGGGERKTTAIDERKGRTKETWKGKDACGISPVRLPGEEREEEVYAMLDSLNRRKKGAACHSLLPFSNRGGGKKRVGARTGS